MGNVHKTEHRGGFRPFMSRKFIKTKYSRNRYEHMGKNARAVPHFVSSPFSTKILPPIRRKVPRGTRWKALTWAIKCHTRSWSLHSSVCVVVVVLAARGAPASDQNSITPSPLRWKSMSHSVELYAELSVHVAATLSRYLWRFYSPLIERSMCVCVCVNNTNTDKRAAP